MARKIPQQPEINIGTAGHVDHGKTTLVEALTGKWTSMHSEELRRGITIKIGYADAPVYYCPDNGSYNTDGACNGKEAQLKRVVSFVDSPGHESLMANMLSGSAIIDGALLVIAANEQVPQPQTREHLQALNMIGVSKLIVVQNKVDLVSYDEAKSNYGKIMDFLESYNHKDVPIVPVSAHTGLNIDALLAVMEKHIPTPQRDVKAPVQMQVIRSFDINKPGSQIEALKGGVLGGTLRAGILRVGDKIEIKPGIYIAERGTYQPVETEVISLATSGGLVESVKPGGLIGVGTRLDPAFTKSDLMLGNYIAAPGVLPDPIIETDLKVELFGSIIGVNDLIKVERLKLKEMLKLNVGTMVTFGTIQELNDDMVHIVLRRPVCALKGTRVAISRRIGDRWRLAGSSTIMS